MDRNAGSVANSRALDLTAAEAEQRSELRALPPDQALSTRRTAKPGSSWSRDLPRGRWAWTAEKSVLRGMDCASFPLCSSC
jgi:hypothetical protein